jgi:hypothetical protein
MNQTATLLLELFLVVQAFVCLCAIQMLMNRKITFRDMIRTPDWYASRLYTEKGNRWRKAYFLMTIIGFILLINIIVAQAMSQ